MFQYPNKNASNDTTMDGYYKSEFDDGEKFTKVILKSGFELPLAISFDDFTKLFFKV